MREFLGDALWVIWVGAALAMALLELTSMDFVFSMLVGGALAAAVAAGFGFNFTVQAFVFTGVSVVGLVVVRPVLKRWAQRSSPEVPTNVDALAGRSAVTLVPVDDRSGQVRLSGETWSARTERRAAPIPADSDVLVLRIEGATAVVRTDPAAESEASPSPAPPNPDPGTPAPGSPAPPA